MSGTSKTPSFIKYLKRSAGIIPLALILLSSTFGAGRADAGVFSLFNVAFGKTPTSETAPTIQRMKILEVVFSPTLNGQGGPDILTDESALISNETPLSADAAVLAFPIDEEKPDVAVDHEGDASIKTYIVKSGDTISGIASQFGISVNTIVWANNLNKKAALKVGEELTILPVSGIQYTVRRGDTLATIAKRYSTEVADIRDFNDKDDDSLTAGEKIIVPGADISPVKTATAAEKPTSIEKPIAAPKTPAPSVAPTPTLAPAVAKTTETPVPAGSIADADLNVEAPVIGTLARPKTNTGSAANFIRPITEGLGRKSQDKHDTWAVDIAVPIGTPIMAAEKGTVILVKPSGYNGGYGLYVVIEHENGVQTLYAHMSKTIAKVGDVVAQGETIGLVGSTGHSTGPHVHYEVRGARNNCFGTCE